MSFRTRWCSWVPVVAVAVLSGLPGAGAAAGQTATDFDVPLVSGERLLRFRVHTGGLRADRLVVTVFYATSRAALANLQDPGLPRGRPVLTLDPLRADVLAAEFVFPHRDYTVDPNRALYARARGAGAEIVRYADVDLQLATSGTGGGSFDPWVPGGGGTASPIDTNPVVHERGTCVFFRVRIARGGTVAFESPARSFVMPDSYNIAVAGDSYGAGEGSPQDGFEPLGDNSDMWSHDDCHRSRRSGLVRAVKRFIARNPDVAVDYVHVACTGARVRNLTRDEQTRAVFDFSEPHPVQFDIVGEAFLGADGEHHDELNLLLVSIGGNDAGFGPYVADFIVLPGNAADDADIEDEIEDGLEQLADRLVELDEEVRERFPAAKIAIATYPDSTRGPLGRCGSAPGPVEFAGAYHCCLEAVDPVTNPVAEYRFTRNSFIRPLNDTLRDAAASGNEPDAWPDWYVLETEARMGDHGFCACQEPFVNRLDMSVVTQGDIFGIAHPTRAGYREVYRDVGAATIARAYGDFVTQRKGALLIALLLGIDSPAIPKPCGQVTPLDPVFQLLRALEVSSPRDQLLRNFVLDDSVRAARRRGTAEALRGTAAYRRLQARQDEAGAILDRAFPAPLRKKTEFPAPVERPSERDARRRLREYLASAEFQARRRAILQSPPTVEAERDPFDGLFNRLEPVRQPVPRQQ